MMERALFFADDPEKLDATSGTLIENNKIIKIDRIVYHYAEDNGEKNGDGEIRKRTALLLCCSK